MASRDSYTVGWVCALPLEMAAAKVLLDHIYVNLPVDPSMNDTNNYVLGSLNGHNVVLACPPAGAYGITSAATVATQIRASFRSIRFILMDNIFLGDVVYDFERECVEDRFTSNEAQNKPSTLLLTAVGKAETNNIFGESQISHYISEIVQKEPITFSYPGPEQDVLFDPDYDHTTAEPSENGCTHCNPNRVHRRPLRGTQNPKVHYGLVASSNQLMCHGLTRDKLAHEHGILCFDTEAAGLMDTAQCLVIRGICDYADSHRSKLWQGYAAAAAAAYAKEILLLIPTAPKPISLAADTYAAAITVLDALLLTRPEVDRSSLIALKGRRVNGTCEWLIRHPIYQEWLMGADPPLLWISGGPGKGKTMLAIYITEVLQPVVDLSQGVLLYYFCSNRDRNRNTAVTIMRGIIHQWLNCHPHLAQHIKNYFEGSETTKYTISSFVSLWRLFLILLHQSGSCQVVCVLDGLDECEKESLKQFLDALKDYFLKSGATLKSKLRLILLSRPQPALLENKLGQYRRIKLDDSDKEVGKDVEKYIFAKVAELASQQTLSEDMLLQVRQALMAGAEGTFLWVGFVADELKGRSWHKIRDILRGVPKGLGGIYRRLLQQVEDKEKLVPILQWIVLAARPLTMDELRAAAETQVSDGLMPTEVIKDRLASLGLLVKIDGDVVNLVHESAKEFFQSDQVNIEGINMFHMNHNTHRTLMRACLTIIEESYKSPGSISASRHDTLLSYASLYWPEHFRHASPIDAPAEFLRPFFREDSPVREVWWRFYWDQEKYGGTPPSFTLLHLAAYFGNVGWAKMLLNQYASDHVFRRRLTSRKDNYGRTPLFWAATRGHRDVVELLLTHGARVNSKDRSKLTALHIAVTREHTGVVSLLLDRSASLEAIQASSKEIVKLLLEHGARVDGLPTPPGVALLKGPMYPLEERAKQLLELQEQLFAARYENSSRLVDITIKTLTLSFQFPPILQLVTFYLKYSSIGRWEVMHVLQDLVKNNKTARLRKWAQAYIRFGTQLIVARNARNLAVMTGLSVQIFQVVSTADLEALLVIGVLVGSSVILAAAQHEWREGVDISARTFAQFASLAYHRDAGESLHYGVREFLIDFDGCIRSSRRAENVARTVVLFSTHFAILDTEDPRPIEYFSTVIAEYFEGYICGSFEEQLFGDASQACANELRAISESHDARRLLLFLTAILQFAQRSREKGQDWFLNMPPASCLILCQNDPAAHRWLIAEAVPETMSTLISQQEQGPTQKRAYKALVEFMIIGKQYGLSLPMTLRQRVKQHLESTDGADGMLDRILSS
ncbi:ankyrin repeat protein [Xylaria intraflava]|nr:ankyrin repeat protein [Xylaria intraflava]